MTLSTVVFIVGMTMAQTKLHADIAKRSFRQIEAELGVELEPVAFVRISKDPCPAKGITFDDIASRLRCYDRAFPHAGVRLVIAPTLRKKYMVVSTGVASRVCDPEGIAAITPFPPRRGRLRNNHTKTAIMHEVGHLLGAAHAFGKHVMNMGFGQWTGTERLHFPGAARAEAAACLE